MNDKALSRTAFFFLAPALVAIGVFFFLPVLAALVLSFTDFDIYALGSFANARVVGLRNYSRLLEDPLFWQALRNTFYFLIVGGPLSVAVSLGAALLLNSRLVRLRSFFRFWFPGRFRCPGRLPARCRL